MQSFTSSELPIPRQPPRCGYNLLDSRVRYGGAARRNENGLLAVVERHRDEIRRKSVLPQPAEPGRI